LIPEHLLHRETPLYSKGVTGLGAHLFLRHPIITRFFPRELVDVCPELRHLYLLILAASFHTPPTTIDIFLLIASAAALCDIPRSIALSLLSSHLPSSPSYPLTPPTMQASQAADATEGAFNFLGLPKELRIMVYKELFGKREE
jgi:hypothetical protein